MIVDPVGSCARFAPVDDALLDRVADGVTVATWGTRGFDHPGGATAFVLAAAAAQVRVAHGVHPIPAHGFAVLPDRARIVGGRGLIVLVDRHRGLFGVGGPVEPTGRLRYIDGARDTVLVAPVVRGAPCLNLLHLPASTVQTDHDHPSVRVGLVVSGSGTCILAGRTEALRQGTVFVLPAGAVHRFETPADDGLRLMAWHPDSDTGPTDDDHPMLNRTLQPGTGLRVR